MNWTPRLRWIAFLLLTSAATVVSAADVTVFFSPDGGVAAQVKARIDAATSEILVAAYSISEPRITAALIAAHRRGVDVQVIVDKTQCSPYYSSSPYLLKNGVTLYTDKLHQLMHSKVMVIDQSITLTGSANYTVSGDHKNMENLVVIIDQTVAQTFRTNWLQHKAHAEAYVVKHEHDELEAPAPPPLPSPKPSPTTKDP